MIARRVHVAALLTFVAGCGRLRFDPVDDGSTDTLVDAAPLPVLGCSGTRGPIIDRADPRLAGFWSFNEGALPATDRGTGAVPMAIAGGAPNALSRMNGSALSVVTGSVSATSTAYAVGTGDVTLEMWVQIADPCVADLNIAASASWSLGCAAGGRARFELGAVRVVSPFSIADGGWHHLAGVRRAGNLELWIDGSLIAGPPAATSIDGVVTIVVGPLAAAVDELRVWRGALASEQLARIALASRPGLFAYWTFDDDYDGFAGLGYSGTPLGGVVRGSGGRAGNAARFAGTDGRIEVMLPDFARNHALVGWFKTAANGAIQSIFDLEPENDSRSPVHLWVDDTQLTTNIRDIANGDFGTSVPIVLVDDCWHQVAVVREGADNQTGAVRIYADGVKVDEVFGTFGVTSDTTDPFRIGFRLMRDFRPFAGTIDEVQVYERVLTDAEIAGLYSALR